MKKNLNYKILNFLVLLGICITLLMLLGTPLITTALLKSEYSLLDKNLVIKISTCIYLCAVPYVIALFNLKKICKLVAKNNAFSLNIVNSLKIISFCSFSEIIIFIMSTTYLKYSTDFFRNALLLGPIFIVIFIGTTIGFLFLVLSQLFKIFIEIKDENDKTI
ncbi:DUF2975 domain-containing protein [Clostridium sp. CTA-7]